jgi:hypothetical protein
VNTFTRPAPSPCTSCPYRRDTPAGIWSSEEYDKLRVYDEPDDPYNPPGVFACHYNDPGDQRLRVCSGWAHVHGPGSPLGLRYSVVSGQISQADASAVIGYVSPVAMFGSGAEAADHGQSRIDNPDTAARTMIARIVARRPDIRSENPVNQCIRCRRSIHLDGDTWRHDSRQRDVICRATPTESHDPQEEGTP